MRSSSVILLDFQNGRYPVPFGLGVGRVFRVGKAINNIWVERQPTIYHNKPGLPAFQLFMGINFQWARGHRNKALRSASLESSRFKPAF